ncbi:hypothetical protein PT286_09785 [Neisseriaceae bacterium ESL0693]|nr:hypothetical protein [Neisseriaceae bacterium ESL0693]
MKLWSLCSVVLVALSLGACASTSGNGQEDASGQAQAYGQIKGGVESSHTNH